MSISTLRPEYWIRIDGRYLRLRGFEEVADEADGRVASGVKQHFGASLGQID